MKNLQMTMDDLFCELAEEQISKPHSNVPSRENDIEKIIETINDSTFSIGDVKYLYKSKSFCGWYVMFIVFKNDYYIEVEWSGDEYVDSQGKKYNPFPEIGTSSEHTLSELGVI